MMSMGCGSSAGGPKSWPHFQILQKIPEGGPVFKYYKNSNLLPV
jgi:hypothetical protein